MLSNTLLLALAFCHTSLSTSIISTFSDSNCQKSFKSLEGPNGYPDGVCTDFRRNGVYSSFQIVSLDPGCAVTIYGNDTTEDPCSASDENKSVAQPIACYNATYHYYSIDMCDTTTATASSTPSATPKKKSNTGAIVGGVLGGVVGLALILGIVFWMIRKKRQEKKAAAMQSSNMAQHTELHALHQNELHAPHQNELHAHHHNEIGSGKVMYRREAVEVEAPPVELGGQEITTSEKAVH